MAKKTKARRAPAAAAAGGDLAPVKRDDDALAAAPSGEGGSEWTAVECETTGDVYW
jgi:hypothetical protein